MFERFDPAPVDPILKLIGLYKEDPRENKIDLGVGVFRDASGNTPIMDAVRVSEGRLHDKQTTKAYVGPAGDEVFNTEMAKLVFGDSLQADRTRAIQTPGGCGALRMLSDMLYKVASDRTVWVTDPTWGNHYPIMQGSGFEVKAYPYLNRDNKTVNVDAMMSKLATLGQKDIVILHGCCHNPTGAELQPAHWDAIAELAVKNGFFPYVDLAYQGFGDSLESDAYGARKLAETVESMVLAASCSKNFGLYRDRVGSAMLIGKNAQETDVARGQILSTARSSYSMPPDHGAAIVSQILTDDGLKSSWDTELTDMRGRLLDLRQKLADSLREKSGSDAWDFIARHRGMFSLLMLSDEQVDSLRNDYAVYAVAGGRVNIAGIQDEVQLNTFADALVAVTQ
ncbi:MAG: aspartate aminotransferase [Saprospiraceae bacterium]|jgi:aspartate aminotransferase